MDSNKNMRRVIICDIDGTMIVHRTHLTNVIKQEPVLLDGVIEKFQQWDLEGHRIILLTGRRESTRKETERELTELGLFWDVLIMNAGADVRVLVNDLRTDGTTTAYAINLERDEGFENVDWEEMGL